MVSAIGFTWPFWTTKGYSYLYGIQSWIPVSTTSAESQSQSRSSMIWERGGGFARMGGGIGDGVFLVAQLKVCIVSQFFFAIAFSFTRVCLCWVESCVYTKEGFAWFVHLLYVTGGGMGFALVGFISQGINDG